MSWAELILHDTAWMQCSCHFASEIRTKPLYRLYAKLFDETNTTFINTHKKICLPKNLHTQSGPTELIKFYWILCALVLLKALGHRHYVCRVGSGRVGSEDDWGRMPQDFGTLLKSQKPHFCILKLSRCRNWMVSANRHSTNSLWVRLYLVVAIVTKQQNLYLRHN